MHISKVCGNLKNKRNGKEMATSSSESESESEEDSFSDEDLEINYMAFGVSHVDVGEEGKNVSICDLKEGIDEEVARDVDDVATLWEVACITSYDQGKGLNEEVDSVTHLSEELVRSKEVEDNLREEVAKARSLLVNMTLSKEKLDAMKIPYEKRGFGFVDDESMPSSDKTIFVKEMVPKLPPQSSYHKKTLEVSDSSKSAPLKIVKDKEMRYLEVLKKTKIKQP
ncbi:hypothetical protein Q3G72_032617 [Acer saccharum]|nr:hypothetical protein Q3G72_032617 [Acer saccharum]